MTACSDLERTAYRTLAVTQAEYETIQRHVAEAAVHSLITAEQWNRFQVEGHRFIDAHNAAVDAFELWSRTKSQAHTARLEAMLEILPRLIRDLNSLVQSLEQKPEVRSQKSGVRREEFKKTRIREANKETKMGEGSAFILNSRLLEF